MNRGSTLLLRGAVIFLGLAALAICTVGLPLAISSNNVGEYRPLLFGVYVPAIPFFIALYQTMKLLGLIDKNQTFSGSAVKALKNIKYCGVAISVLYTAGMPYIFYVADKDDAPGVVLFGLIIIGASFVIATFAGVLQKLLQNVIDIKSENDLTV